PEVEFPCVTLATEGLELGITVCACGMLPEPGVPEPGKTVPCCRLPNFGCVDKGAAAVVVVASGGWTFVVGWFSGTLIGGSFWGAGMGSGADGTVSAGGGAGV